MYDKEPLLRFEEISKDYYGNKVLSDVSFTVNRGEIVALVGENGAGKSTLMNILFGMNVIHATGGYGGKIYIDGRETIFANSLDALNSGIGMVHQEFSLIPGFSAMENILLNRESMDYHVVAELFGDEFYILDREDMRRRAEKAISRLEVEIKPETLVADMSVGQKQFTEIAREIDRTQTKILILDEPTAVLAESEAETMIQALRRLAAQGIGIIFISHRLKEVIDLCDRVIVLRDGSVISDVPSKETNIREIANWMVGRNLEEAKRIVKCSTEADRKDVYLSIQNLWADMPGETVRNVSIDVYREEILGIGGLAGQGKVGIPNGIMGLCPAGGRIHFDGQPFRLNDPKAAIEQGFAFVSEDRRGVGLLLDEGIDRNITFTAMKIRGDFLKHYLGGLFTQSDDDAVRACAEEYIRKLDIKCTSPGQKVLELSGGNQQKVCLAKAFALQPKILFVSEPTRGIDVGAKMLVLDALRRYNKEQKTTIVMISSELEELRSICSRIAIIDEGRIAGILPPDAPAEEFGLLMSGNAEEAICHA
ncbi:sugar ABC transporter ATP-binding protein [Aminivibrio sp.]